jgi:hypothetical protein
MLLDNVQYKGNRYQTVGGNATERKDHGFKVAWAKTKKRIFLSISCQRLLEELVVKRVLVSIAAVVALFVLAASPLAAQEIAITVSPNVINIASASTLVTVHTDIPYSAVAGATVELNGIGISWWKSDNRGYFVAKFEAGEVKGIVEPGTTATLTLTGQTKDGQPFSGSDDVDVIDVKQKG